MALSAGRPAIKRPPVTNAPPETAGGNRFHMKQQGLFWAEIDRRQAGGRKQVKIDLLCFTQFEE